jgi:hypothetical protein
MMPGMNEQDREFLSEQAEKCRWLARNSRDPKIVLSLYAMASDFETRAVALGTEHGD